MNETELKYLYNWIDDMINEIVEQIDISYLDGLLEKLEALFYNEGPREENNEILVKNIEQKLNKINIDQYSVETIRKAVQLALIKSMNENNQNQHLMTPYAVILIISYIVHMIH